jgi:hypothetical protein
MRESSNFDDAESLRQSVAHFGLEDTFRTYYSSYKAFVADNEDPKELGRVKILCPEVGHNENKPPVDVWVPPANGITGNRFGWFDPPLVGSVVRVEFDNGDPGKPKAYYGGYFTEADGKSPVPSEFGYVNGKPQKRGFRSRAGHYLLFNDAAGEEKVELFWHQISSGDPAASDPDKVAADVVAGDKFAVLSFNEDAVQIRDAEGQLFVLNTKEKQITLQDANGNLITTSADGISLIDGKSSIGMDGKGDVNIIAAKNLNLNAPNINLKSGGVYLGDGAALSVAVADLLFPWLASHTHTATGPSSPTTPPVAPPPPFKSEAIKVKV